jgi:DNA primase
MLSQSLFTLKRRGVNHLGHCPFHNEKTPSFTVSQAKGIFKCFGCGKGGNAVNFIMELEQLSYPDALRWLAKKYHIEIAEKEESPEEKLLKDERESMMIVSSFAQKYFSRQLLEENEGRTVGLSYLRERGIRDDIIRKFELGYCPEGKDHFTAKPRSRVTAWNFSKKPGSPSNAMTGSATVLPGGSCSRSTMWPGGSLLLAAAS